MSDRRLLMPDWMAQFVLRFQLNGKPVSNVIYFRKQVFAVALPTDDWVDEAWLGEDITTDANNIMAAYIAHFLPLATSSCSLERVDWVFNEAVATGPLHEGSSTHSPAVGSNPGDTLPNNVSLAVHLGTGLGGRSRMGRMFFPGVGEGLIDGPAWNTIKPGSVADFTTAGGDFLDAVNSTPDVPVIGDKRNKMIVASFVHNHLPRGEALGTNVSSIGLRNNRVDTMKRRLPK